MVAESLLIISDNSIIFLFKVLDCLYLCHILLHVPLLAHDYVALCIGQVNNLFCGMKFDQLFVRFLIMDTVTAFPRSPCLSVKLATLSLVESF